MAINTYSLADPTVRGAVQLHHRHTVLADGITFDWTASALRFVAVCAGEVTVKMRFSASYKQEGVDRVAFTILLDGVRQEGYRLLENLREGQVVDFTFSVGDERREREITFCRQSEREKACIDLLSFTINGELGQAKPRKALIEFVGDSVTCGGANHGGSNGNGRVDDGTHTYAFLTAQALGLDWRMVSNSGTGLLFDSSGKVGPIAEWLSGYRLQNVLRDQTLPYTHQEDADIICLYLGTNDTHTRLNNHTPCTDEQWAMGVRQMVGIVRNYNPRAKIVWLVGGMVSGYGKPVEAAFAAMGGEDNGLYICTIPDTYHGGGAWHPSVAEHTEMGALFTAFLQEKGLA